MSFVYTKCYKCNKRVKVNDAEDAWICKFCKKPFVIEKAMKLYRENSHDGEHVRKKVEVKKASANVSADSMIPENIVITMPIEETPAVNPISSARSFLFQRLSLKIRNLPHQRLS